MNSCFPRNLDGFFQINLLNVFHLFRPGSVHSAAQCEAALRGRCAVVRQAGCAGHCHPAAAWGAWVEAENAAAAWEPDSRGVVPKELRAAAQAHAQLANGRAAALDDREIQGAWLAAYWECSGTAPQAEARCLGEPAESLDSCAAAHLQGVHGFHRVSCRTVGLRYDVHDVAFPAVGRFHHRCPALRSFRRECQEVALRSFGPEGRELCSWAAALSGALLR